MIRKPSEWCMAALVVVSFVVSSNAAVKSLNVTTNNHTYRKYSAAEGTSGPFVNFTLPPMGSVTNAIPEPSSGTTTLSAYFTPVSSGTQFNCQAAYNVNTTSAAVVTVQNSSGTLNCKIRFN